MLDSLKDSTRLLADIRDVFEQDTSPTFLTSKKLVELLLAIDDAPWSDKGLTMNQLARKLHPYGVGPRQNATKTARGYHLSDLTDAFARYLPSPTVQASEQGLDQHESADTSPEKDCPSTCPQDSADSLGDSSELGGCPEETAAEDAYADTWTGSDGSTLKDVPACDSGASPVLASPSASHTSADAATAANDGVQGS